MKHGLAGHPCGVSKSDIGGESSVPRNEWAFDVYMEVNGVKFECQEFNELGSGVEAWTWTRSSMWILIKRTMKDGLVPRMYRSNVQVLPGSS